MTDARGGIGERAQRDHKAGVSASMTKAVVAARIPSDRRGNGEMADGNPVRASGSNVIFEVRLSDEGFAIAARAIYILTLQS